MSVTDSNNTLLQMTIEATVPFKIWELQQRGGPTDTDWEWAATQTDVIAEKGDVILYKDPKRGVTGSLMGNLIRVLAIMAFVPGGVTFAGIHFDAGMTNGHA